uniref:Uncharacterized protein n=1 Tax=Siphoviridae sp. ctrgt10 TaxID=2826479 RepID=A0A8S5M7A1_9CAUD|nr:MAG TPA: hypothetical protein [Siphoviridae sp. ctrgt10]
MRNKNLCLKRDEQRSKPLNNFENDKFRRKYKKWQPKKI